MAFWDVVTAPSVRYRKTGTSPQEEFRRAIQALRQDVLKVFQRRRGYQSGRLIDFGFWNKRLIAAEDVSWVIHEKCPLSPVGAYQQKLCLSEKHPVPMITGAVFRSLALLANFSTGLSQQWSFRSKRCTSLTFLNVARHRFERPKRLKSPLARNMEASRSMIVATKDNRRAWKGCDSRNTYRQHAVPSRQTPGHLELLQECAGHANPSSSISFKTARP